MTNTEKPIAELHIYMFKNTKVKVIGTIGDKVNSIFMLHAAQGKIMDFDPNKAVALPLNGMGNKLIPPIK